MSRTSHKASAEQDQTTEQAPVVLPEVVAEVKRNVTLRGVAAYQGKSDRAHVQASVGLAFLKARGALPPVREVEVKTGISKSKVSRMVAIGTVAIALRATVAEAIDFQYLYEHATYGGSLAKVEKAFGKPLSTEGARAEALEWIATEAARLRELVGEESETRAARPDDGSKGDGGPEAVKIPVTFERKVEAAHAILSHLAGEDVEIPAPDDISEETHALVKAIVKAAHRLALSTGDEAVKPVRTRAAKAA